MIEVRLEALMRERGVGVVALAQQAEVHTTQLYTRLRRPDRMHLRTLDRVCTALGVTPGEVLVQTGVADLGEPPTSVNLYTCEPS
ncbi:MAG: helix-turn-helix domain-containing protein [Dehalococcoidia bacterium]